MKMSQQPLHASRSQPDPVEGHHDAPLQNLPYAREELQANGTIVVKIGGSTLGGHDTTLEDLAALQRQGVNAVVVHGGGKVITDWMEKQGVKPRFVRGLRVTDAPSLEIVVAVLAGLVNKTLVASLNAQGARAIGISGADGGMLRAVVKDPELGLVGSVVEVHPEPIKAMLDAGFIPVIAPVAVQCEEIPLNPPLQKGEIMGQLQKGEIMGQLQKGEITSQPSQGAETTSPPFAKGDAGGFQLLNINADTAAGEIAAALGAERLVFLTDVEGVLDSSRRLIPRLTERQARGLIASNVAAGGMIPKLEACLTALKDGSIAQIIDGRKPRALLDILSGSALGTRVG
jgi:acetylglutamate kinase